jgi:GNAT superfamily N-acetyltransferase
LNDHQTTVVIMPTIRIAELSDIRACARLLNILFSQEHEFTPDLKKQEAGLEMIIADPSAGTIFVCEENGQVVGMISALNLISTAIGKKVLMLEDMIIDPALRGRGIGAMLIEYVIRWAREQDYGRMTLLTDGDNIPAQHFYEEHGFIRSTMVAYRKRL